VFSGVKNGPNALAAGARPDSAEGVYTASPDLQARQRGGKGGEKTTNKGKGRKEE